MLMHFYTRERGSLLTSLLAPQQGKARAGRRPRHKLKIKQVDWACSTPKGCSVSPGLAGAPWSLISNALDLIYDAKQLQEPGSVV
jgi:hypothetical protein